ncbi:MAG: response regulator [Myxococcales bacterium]|nr:response regulator [Myxococcales bacterium]
MCPQPEEPSLPVVLVVEDEPTLRASIVRGLSRAVRASIVGAGSVAEARQIIEERAPSMMISDIDLPDGTGLELVAHLDARERHVPIVFVSSYVRHYEGRVPTRAGIETYEKPLPLERLRHIVESALARGSTPDPSPFCAADYLQLAGIGRKSVLVHVKTSQLTGRIFVRGGAVLAAEDSLGVGMAAFRRIVFAEGEVSCRALRAGDEPAPNLEGNCEELLMEAARLNDEASITTSGEYSATGRTSRFPSLPPSRFSLPAPPIRPSSPPASVRANGDPFEEAYGSGVDALLERRYEDAFALFTKANGMRPGDSRVSANLARLATLLESKNTG